MNKPSHNNSIKEKCTIDFSILSPGVQCQRCSLKPCSKTCPYVKSVSKESSNPTADVTLYRSSLFKTIEGLKEKPFGTEFISVVKDTNFEVEKKNGEIYQAGFNSALDQILNIIKE